MPLYFILSKSKFSSKEKERLAKTITDVHCAITKAPSNYVTVIFLSGYSLKSRKKIMLLGNIREGGNRTKEMIEQLGHGLLMGIVNTLHTATHKVGLQFLKIPFLWVWESGKVLPAPGQEPVQIANLQ